MIKNELRKRIDELAKGSAEQEGRAEGRGEGGVGWGGEHHMAESSSPRLRLNFRMSHTASKDNPSIDLREPLAATCIW